jgi:hypothetical protein
LEYMMRSSRLGNPLARIPAVTLSERALGVNEPDGSPSGSAIVRGEQSTHCAACAFFTELAPAERYVGATTEVPVSAFVAPPVSADDASRRNQGIEMLESDREKSHRWIAIVGVYQGRK